MNEQEIAQAMSLNEAFCLSVGRSIHKGVEEIIMGKKEPENSIETKYLNILKKGGKLIAEMPRASNPKLSYKVIQTVEGYIYCSCPSWIFQKKPPEHRKCKHTNSVMGECATAQVDVKEYSKAKTEAQQTREAETYAQELKKSFKKQNSFLTTQTWGKR